MANKILIIATGIFLFIGIIGEVLIFTGYKDVLILQIVAELGKLCGAVMVFYKNILQRASRYHKFVIIFFILGLISIWTPIKLPLGYSNLLFITVFVTIGITYIVYFFKKTDKHLLDIFKFLWIIIILITILFKIQHYSFINELRQIENIAFILMYIVFIISYYKKDKEIKQVRK